MVQQAIQDLLARSRSGDPSAASDLVPLVYDQLRALAAHYLRAERPGHTLRPTALVHEAYLRIAQADLPFQDRVHLLAVAATAMRRVLVDHARGRSRQKRGDGAVKVSLEEAAPLLEQNAAPVEPLLTDIDDALERLAQFDPRKSRIVELLYFGGLTYDETAEAVGISPATVHREARVAKAWLRNELGVK
jgi:RNA polymerase sigma factor (TIGR02999 family)